MEYLLFGINVFTLAVLWWVIREQGRSNREASQITIEMAMILERNAQEALSKLMESQAAAAAERTRLEDRMMAMTNYDQLSMFKATQDEGGEIEASYIDEEEEAKQEGLISNNGNA